MDDEDYAVCPYNNSHLIRKYKMPGHMVKCFKTYSGPPLFPCMYNAQHLMKEDELNEHLKECREYRLANQQYFAKMAKNFYTNPKALPCFDDDTNNDDDVDHDDEHDEVTLNNSSSSSYSEQRHCNVPGHLVKRQNISSYNKTEKTAKNLPCFEDDAE